jgi:signal transduction histidine kinase
VEIILKDKEPDPKMDKSIELLKAGVEQAINVIDSLMGSVRKTEVDLEKIQISEYLYKIMGNVRVPENVQLIVENREAIVELPPIMADTKQLERVFQNLLKNAFEAMPDGGAITICPSISDSYLRVEIKDTGKGIPPENIVKVFEPLFTSKTGSGGTGIGLSVCRSIIEAHDGTIAVESEEGRGAKFTIQLPFLAS